jgi:hypothetical protein
MVPPASADASWPFVRLSTVAERPLSWLCPGRLALGTLALFDGDFGLGSSLVALDLAAPLSTGRDFPDAGPGPPPSPELIFPGDGGDADLVGRLRALGADLAQGFRSPRDGPANPLRLAGRTGALQRALRLGATSRAAPAEMAAPIQRGPVDHHLDRPPVTRWGDRVTR